MKPGEVTAPMPRYSDTHANRPVTGPDGDSPITDEQIRELYLAGAIESQTYVRSVRTGVLDRHLRRQRREARARCVTVWNARHGAGGTE